MNIPCRCKFIQRITGAMLQTLTELKMYVAFGVSKMLWFFLKLLQIEQDSFSTPEKCTKKVTLKSLNSLKTSG